MMSDDEPQELDAAAEPPEVVEIAIPEPDPLHEPPMAHSLIAQTRVTMGPLPDPLILREYDDLVPGAADRIIRMAELEQQHHHHTHEDSLRIETRGQWMALVTALSFLGAAIALIVAGEPIWGVIVLIAVISGLVGIFVVGKLQQQREPESSDEQRLFDPDDLA